MSLNIILCGHLALKVKDTLIIVSVVTALEPFESAVVSV